MVEKRIFLSCKWLFSSQPGVYTCLPFSAHLKSVIFWLANKLVLWRRRRGFWFALSSVRQCNAVCLRDDTFLCAVGGGAGVSSQSVVFFCKTPTSFLYFTIKPPWDGFPCPRNGTLPKGLPANFLWCPGGQGSDARVSDLSVFPPLMLGSLPSHVLPPLGPPLPSSLPVSTWLYLHGFWCWLCFQTHWTILSHRYAAGEGDKWLLSLSVWCWEE